MEEGRLVRESVGSPKSSRYTGPHVRLVRACPDLPLCSGPLLLEASLPPPTVVIEADSKFTHISSTKVRQFASEGKSLSGLVPDAVADRISRAYGPK